MHQNDEVIGGPKALQFQIDRDRKAALAQIEKQDKHETTPNEDQALIFAIERLGNDLDSMHTRVSNRIRTQARDADDREATDMQYSEPGRWLAMAKTDFQTGLMKLKRAIDQPTTFDGRHF